MTISSCLITNWKTWGFVMHFFMRVKKIYKRHRAGHSTSDFSYPYKQFETQLEALPRAQAEKYCPILEMKMRKIITKVSVLMIIMFWKTTMSS